MFCSFSCFSCLPHVTFFQKFLHAMYCRAFSLLPTLKEPIIMTGRRDSVPRGCSLSAFGYISHVWTGETIMEVANNRRWATPPCFMAWTHCTFFLERCICQKLSRPPTQTQAPSPSLSSVSAEDRVYCWRLENWTESLLDLAKPTMRGAIKTCDLWLVGGVRLL